MIVFPHKHVNSFQVRNEADRFDTLLGSIVPALSAAALIHGVQSDFVIKWEIVLPGC
jgi:hypothetical protein